MSDRFNGSYNQSVYKLYLLYILNSFGENHTTPCTLFCERSTVFSQQGKNDIENKGLIKSVNKYTT